MAGFNANEFRSNLKYGGARPNLFKVDLTLPDSVEAERSFSFMCEAASEPAYTVGFADTYYFGRRISTFGDREFSDFSCTLINDEDYAIRNALKAWQDRGARGDWGTSHIEQANGLQLYTDITVTAFGKEGEPINAVKLINAFPIMVGPLEFSWSANNTIQRYSVDFRFDYYTDV